MTNNLDKDVTITFTRKQLVETILAIKSCFFLDIKTTAITELHEVLNKIKLATKKKEDK
mgnify:CR=1 FL=1